MRRMMLFDRGGGHIGEIPPADVFALERREEINGEHSLEITTTHVLSKGSRLVYQDGRGKWREYVVMGVDEQHESGLSPIGTYYCTWSLQPDLMGTTVSAMPGVQAPVAAGVALEAALGGTARWTVGTVTNTSTGGASMYDMSGWQALGKLVETWGGEVEATIEVSPTGGVTGRKVDLYAQMGRQTALRRYDFGADVRGVKRTYPDGPLYCRLSPRGKGEQSDGGGYGRKIRISDANGGLDYLTYAPMVDVAKLPDGNGGWEYPTLIAENSECETPAALKEWAQGVIEDMLVPKVTYEVDVLQAAAEGVDVQGVSLGDKVNVVDRHFGADGLRLSGRVVSVTVDELSGRGETVKIGYLDNGLSDALKGLLGRMDMVAGVVQVMNGGTMTTADYLNRLLERINAEINATGGYTYITEGEGIRTYDKAVSDPLVGAEADAVVEIKGGTIRIANSRTAQGEWEWRSVFTSGHIAADVVTAAQLTSGYIGSPSGNYWNLDTGELRMASTSTMVGNQTLEQYVQSHSADIDYDQITLDQQRVFNALTDNGRLPGIFMQGGQLYVNANYLKTGIITDNVGNNYWNLNTGEFSLSGYATDEELEGVNTTAKSALSKANEQVGGTNLLIDSSVKGMAKHSASANRYWSHTATNPTETWVDLDVAARPAGGITCAIQTAIKANQKDKASGICFYSGKAVRMVSGQTYTVSCWARKTAGGAAQVKFQYGQTEYVGSKRLDITGGWKRYSWTFKFDQARAGGSGGARMYFYAYAKTASATTVQMCGFKLETGTKPTDWSPAPEDANYGVNKALTDAKSYANAKAKDAKTYTDKQRKLLDDSFNQEKVLNRLTRNGAAKGIYRDKKGNLYINGTYIKSGTIDAGYVKTGLIKDTKNSNQWNLATGAMRTKNIAIDSGLVSGSMKMASSAGAKSDYLGLSSRGIEIIGSRANNGGLIKVEPGKNYGSRYSNKTYLTFQPASGNANSANCELNFNMPIKDTVSGYLWVVDDVTVMQGGGSVSSVKLSIATLTFRNGLLIKVDKGHHYTIAGKTRLA